ncbi:acetylornithine deacetylase [Thalassococcus sp. S3]|uniref:acetylornithine deacetylase n=1 Tax=Thalassococcus sp. S3 TaxID=2017482 RepID=UPI0010245975|nr:acetylornithine deacetylase [Thalassococcus sp. S3]QBF30211.1 acetylornithine deacetylase [Thalassococcus sp. S3]
MTTTKDILSRLVGFDTVSSRPNLDLIAFAEDFLTSRGFSAHRITKDTGEKCGLYAQLGPSGDGILLSGHTDVVPVDGQVWTRSPFRLSEEDGKLFGRGTTDMKGFVAAMLSLADRAARADLQEPLRLVLSYDEEVGCVGLQDMLARLAPLLGQPRVCIVGEPTEMQVAIGHKGKASLRATCHGQSGHSALAPNFVNALYLATDLVAELRGLQAELCEGGGRDPAYDIPYSTLHVGKLSGGTALNIVPDRAEVTFEYRHLAADRPADILARIKRAGRKVQKMHAKLGSNARIDIDQYNAYPGLDVAPSDLVVSDVQRLAQTNETVKVAFGTEAGFFSELGIPTVVCGPGSMAGQGHKADEFISCEQLAACDAMMDRILGELTD